ncbi:hypothetical protein HELRODRAFT_66928, partial [Helobdella robusta]|uniref:Mitogen-activated protein kinase n=1 Tax=Helobdella robusta TaxID=6412 RepID=T1FYT4_HELRO
METEIEEHISQKYEIKKRLGKGAYGIVWKVADKKTRKILALKKIFDAFRNRTDAQRTFREIMFLMAFGDHPNIIKLYDVLKAHNNKDIYLVFEHMETDLHNVIKKGDILQDIHVRFVMYQLFKALKYLHSGNVIHRDLKPSNVLLNSECQVKMCDFGLARSLSQIPVDEEGSPNLTEYIATRWYRAPEILLASHRYTAGIDQWSMGCILGEMFLGKPLFPGSSTLNQLERIMSIIDRPSQKDIESMQSDYGATVTEATSIVYRSLEELFPARDEDGFHMLKNLLQFNPDKRLTSDQALKHPYVFKFHKSGEVMAMDHEVLPMLDDAVQLSLDQYRDKLYSVGL